MTSPPVVLKYFMQKLNIERLRQLHEQKGWSIKDLAQMSGCEVSTLRGGNRGSSRLAHVL
jgi:transcriptional regulator with XRE-family HTH domain